jgi:hypothetical protein
VIAAELADGVVERFGLLEVAQVTGAGDHDEVRVGDRVLEAASDAQRRAPLAPCRKTSGGPSPTRS